MKSKKILTALMAASLCGATTAPHADDIDLYTGGPSVTGAAANVLIVLDNTSNFSASNQGWTDSGGSNIAQGVVEAETISTVIGALTDSVNVGMKQYADEGGGYPIYAVRPMSGTNRTVFQSVAAKIKANVGSPEYKGPSDAQYGNLLNSSFRYFNGFGRFMDTTSSGGEPSAATDLRDYSGNAVPEPTRATLGSHGYALVDGTAAAPPTATNYKKPADAGAGCAKNYIIFIGNGYPQANSTKFATAKTDLTAAGALFSPAVVPDLTGISEADSLNQIGPYWTKFMRYGNSANPNTGGVKSSIADATVPGGYQYNPITTYTIDVCKNNCDASQATMLKSMAKYGGGKYFKTTDATALKNALSQIFAEIQAVNSVFASATLPISVNTQGTYENQVYIGVFRPENGARPRWFGNLKEYKFGRYCDADGDGKVAIDSTRVQPITGTWTAADERVADDVTSPTCATGVELKLYLADQLGYRAIDETGNTGFIDLQAKSYWTSDSAFWAHNPIYPGGISDSPDGPNVERGAGAQRLRTSWSATPSGSHPDGRKVFTCLGTCLAAAQGDALRTLSHTDNIFYAGNGLVTAALPVPSSTAVSISLARVGNTVTATSVGNHGFSNNVTVTIAGATQTEYNGAKTITYISTTQFSFLVTESPGADSGTVALTTGTATYSISSLAIASPVYNSGTGTVTATATATLTTTPVLISPASISGATQSFLNGAGKTITTSTSPTFSYSVDVTPANTSYATRKTYASGYPTAKGGASTTAINITDIYYLASGTKAVVRLASAVHNDSNYGATKAVRITGAIAPYTATGSVYSDWTQVDKGSGCDANIPNADKNNWFCFTLPLANLYLASDPGAAKTATMAATSYPITISRTVGSTTATATVNAVHTLVDSDSINISGATNTQYNGSWTVAALSGNAAGSTFTFGPVTLSPVTPATGVITATGGGATPKPATADLINWTRGKDLWEDENLNSSLADVRASIHGDVLHSRPAVINYGGTIGIVGFYGSNDGFLRAIHGGINNADGEEKWAFIPSEFVNYTKLSRLYNNAETIRFPNTSCSVSPTPTSRDYFWDGQITVYQSSTNRYYYGSQNTHYATEADCKTTEGVTSCYARPEKTVIYASMRRGGRSLYALDVSLPDEPKVLWKIDHTMTNFSQLGYTWSEPKVVKIKGKKADNSVDIRDVVVFGAGYDPEDDDQPSGCPHGDHTSALTGSFSSGGGTVSCPTAGLSTYTGIGRGVFVVDALTGAYINRLAVPATAFKYSIPADVNMIDMDGDTFIDRIYAADSGGQLFRFDVDSTQQLTASTAFKAYHLASLGDTARSAGNDQRKFMFPPEIVPFAYKKLDNSTVTAVMVLAGTGNREKPLPNRDASNNLNILTCSSIYDTTYLGTYYGAKIRDKFYGLIDTVPTLGTAAAVATEADLSAVNQPFVSNPTAADLALTSYDLCKSFETTCSSPLKRGWYLHFKNTVGGSSARDEEKLVNAPRVVSGIVFFGTNTPKAPNPASGICSNLGQAMAYAVSPFTGMPAFNRDNSTTTVGGETVATYTQADYAATVSGGGLPPTVTAGVVGIAGSFYRFVIGGGGSSLSTPSAIAGAKNPITLKGTRSRVYWYYPVDEN